MALQLMDKKIKNLTDEELISKVRSLVRQEKQIVETLIWHLQEVQDRKLFITMGFTSLFECLVKHFHYSEAVAYQRISALKIISAVPAAAQALAAGEVTLTTLSLTQTFIAKQEKESGIKICAEEKVKYLAAVKNKSTREVKETLAQINPTLELPADRINYLTANDIQLLITTDKALLEKIDKLKSLISHENTAPTYNELLHLAFDAAIEKKGKSKGLCIKLPTTKKTALASVRKNTVNPTDLQAVTQGNSVKSSKPVDIHWKKASPTADRYIPRSVKQNALQKSDGRCQFVDQDGSRCDSRFQLQFDHITPISRGGASSFENIQVLCRVHNAFKADKIASC